MHPCEGILSEPWPVSPRHDPSAPEAYASYSKEYDTLKFRKLSASPELTVTLAGPSTPQRVAENGVIRFTATLTFSSLSPFCEYEGIEDNTDFTSTIVVKLSDSGIFRKESRGGCHGAYQLFTSLDCLPHSRVEFYSWNGSLRRPRGPGGRFLPLPPEPTEEPNEENGWVELRLGESVSREVELDLMSTNGGWGKEFREQERGKEYWVAYSPDKKVAQQGPGVRTWRYGSLENWKGREVTLENTLWFEPRWVTIPVDKSNGVHFIF